MRRDTLAATRARGPARSLAIALIALVVLLAGLPRGRPEGAEFGPETDLCSALQGLGPGEEITLRSGHYRAGCALRRGGTPGAPIVIRSADMTHPAHLVAPPGTPSILSIRASDVTLRGLHFGPTGGDVEGVRIVSGHRITVEDCQFDQMGGFAVVAADSSVRNLTVRQNRISASSATAMSLGCRDGVSCILTGLVIEKNVIRSVSAVTPQLGYGLQLQLNSSAIIRDNVIMDTKGAGIMLHGSVDLATASLIERNFVQGSRASSGILVGGGPVVVRNNIAAWNFDAGIKLENYMRRGLVRAVTVAHNTLYANLQGGLEAPGHSPMEATFLNNAVHARAGTLPLPLPRPGLRMLGNVDCSWAPCFANPDALDFSPFAGSILAGRGPSQPDPMVPIDDFFAAPRAAPPTVGAVDRPSGPIRPGSRP